MINRIWPKGFMLVALVSSVSVAIYAANFHQAETLLSQQAGAAKSALPEKNLQHLLSQLDNRLKQDRQDHEASLFKAMLYFNTGALQKALREIEQLTQRAPDFHLAHLVKGDILMSRFRPVSDVGESPLLQNINAKEKQKLQQLRAEVEARLKAMVEKELGDKVPMQLLGLGKSTDIAILVEKKYNRLYVYGRTSEHEPPRLIRDYYVSTGKKRGNKLSRGDLRTPEGVYFVTAWIPDKRLPDKYGVGAFPVNYPNELDRKLGKTGNGIWLHGTDRGSYSRPPLDSEGCVVLPNIDLSGLKKEIIPGKTPVVITEQANWLDRAEWLQQRQEIMAELEQWRKDWESLDADKYLSHYSSNFWAKGHDLRSWSARKRFLSRSKTYQRIKLSDIALFAYPLKDSQQATVVVRFRQQYESNNYHGDVHKRLYLRKDGLRWRILYEGA